MRRRFSRRQRRILALVAGGRCAKCKDPLTTSFHADHRQPFSRGGPTNLRNGQALCVPCNLLKGNKVTTTSHTVGLRNWQTLSLAKALSWYEAGSDRHFVINAAPGAGKTRAAIVIAASLLERGLIERVVVIAPRSGVVDQWSDAFTAIVGRPMARLTSSDASMVAVADHLCATWAAVSGLADAFQMICQQKSTLVICDEQHHAAIEAAWGRSADSAFAAARFVLILTGTPTRSDGSASLWLPYDRLGVSRHPEGGTYTLTYGEAVDLGYCRPATFHRHQGRFSVILGGGESFEVTSDDEAPVPAHPHRAVAELQKALDFYSLAKRCQFERDGVTPLHDGYHASMIGEASLKLDDLRDEMPAAGGLVIAPSIAVAEHFAQLILRIEGEPAIIVHSGIPNATAKIAMYRQGHTRWLVSVGMVSEGIDIPRLRVLVLLPSGRTELVFRQALGRVVRTCGPNDRTRAYVVMPACGTFEEYARRIEADMPPAGAVPSDVAPHRKCPVCEEHNGRGALECSSCGHAFPERRIEFRVCASCQALTPCRSASCQTCGATDQATHVIKLEQAERNGVIVRGMLVKEADVVRAEAQAADLREQMLDIDDEQLLIFVSRIPLEMMPSLESFFAKSLAARAGFTNRLDADQLGIAGAATDDTSGEPAGHPVTSIENLPARSAL